MRHMLEFPTYMSLWLFRVAIFLAVILPAFLGVYQWQNGRRILGAVVIAALLILDVSIAMHPSWVR